MRCAWQEFIKLLPIWMRESVDELGKDSLQELRLRIGLPPELNLGAKSLWLYRNVCEEDIHFIINTASRYSPWAAKTTAKGYITATGGHRIGLCGDAVIRDNSILSLRNVTSMCLRVARDFPGIAEQTKEYPGSILILGKPGSGKTTLLRDIIRQRSNTAEGSIAVVDERCELFPMNQEKICFSPGKRTDIMTGCSKKEGISVLLRTMGPSCIAVDEITQAEDCEALIEAGWSGVTLLATAHASSRNDLLCRPVYNPIVSKKLFDYLIIMQTDKSWKVERM